jgi:hypothetical protein
MQECVLVANVILQSTENMPDQQLHWSQNPLFLIRSSCKQCHTTDLWKQYLHFFNNEIYDQENHPNIKLNKIWQIFKNLEKKFVLWSQDEASLWAIVWFGTIHYTRET